MIMVLIYLIFLQLKYHSHKIYVIWFPTTGIELILLHGAI